MDLCIKGEKMTFYKVLPKYDGIYNSKIWSYVQNELFTEKEVERLNLNKKFMEKVEIKKQNTYWSFGARKEYTGA